MAPSCDGGDAERLATGREVTRMNGDISGGYGVSLLAFAAQFSLERQRLGGINVGRSSDNVGDLGGRADRSG
jgi:hypothetical protein